MDVFNKGKNILGKNRMRKHRKDDDNKDEEDKEKHMKDVARKDKETRFESNEDEAFIMKAEMTKIGTKIWMEAMM